MTLEEGNTRSAVRNAGADGGRRAVRLALAVLGLLMGFAGIPLFALGLILLFRHETIAGLLFGLALLFLVGMLAALIFAVASFRRMRRWHAPMVFFGSGTGVLVVVLAILTPPGFATSGSRVHSVYLGDAGYSRFSPANLLPEIDQVKLGAVIAPHFDPYIGDDQSERLVALAMDVYRPMQDDPEFRDLGSVLNHAYSDLFGAASDVGHMYYYTPDEGADTPLPALIFLHGSAGNFKGYFYLWKQFADSYGYAVVCPSYGFGNWDEAGIATVERARDFAVSSLGADPDNVILAGLSNGGRGVSRTIRRYPERYRGAVFISGVVEPEILASREFADTWNNRPILTIHGAGDRRIPAETIRSFGRAMSANGIAVTEEHMKDQDHFLFFDEPGVVFKLVDEWAAVTKRP